VTAGATPHRRSVETTDQTENLLGALSLAITDRVDDAVTDAAGQAATGAIALSALEHFLDRPSIDTLAQVLGLSSSGTVRLVDRLEGAGLVRRERAGDGRVTRLVPTAEGERVAREVTAARREVLRDALRVLDADEQAALGELAGRILGGLVRPPGAVRWTCRLCDMGACGWYDDRCPVALAAGHHPAARS
jgi:DNA-binding MarR family transcriptional regulator